MEKDDLIKLLDSKIENGYSVIEESLNSVHNHISEISSSLDIIRYLELVKGKFSNK